MHNQRIFVVVVVVYLGGWSWLTVKLSYTARLIWRGPFWVSRRQTFLKDGHILLAPKEPLVKREMTANQYYHRYMLLSLLSVLFKRMELTTSPRSYKSCYVALRIVFSHTAVFYHATFLTKRAIPLWTLRDEIVFRHCISSGCAEDFSLQDTRKSAERGTPWLIKHPMVFNVPFSGSGTLNKKQILNTIPVLAV